MPAPAVYIVPAIITAFVTGYVFHRFVYEPHIAPALERMAEDFLASRRVRARRLATPVDAGHPPPSGGDNPDDIPLNERRRGRRSSASDSDDSGDEESAPLLGAQSSTTARGPNLNENGDANATLRRRPFTSGPVVVNNVQEYSAPHPRTHSSPIAREDSNGPNSIATSPRRLRLVSNSNNHHVFGSEHNHHQVTAVPTPDNRPRLEPTAIVPPSPAPSGVSRSDVHEWRRTVALHGDRRRQGQGQPMRPAGDRRPLPSPSTVHPVPFVPTLPPPPAVFHVLDEPNPDTLPQTPIYPTHVITDSSVPSTPSSTMSGGRNIMFTPPPQMSPLRNSAISADAGANVATGTNPSDLDPWNGALSPRNEGLGVSVSVPSVAQSTTTISSQTDTSGASSLTSQLLVPPLNASGVGAPPQLPPFSPLSSMHASTHSAYSNQPAPVQTPQLPTLQSPPPQTPRTPPYLLTPSAQHPHHVHYPAPPNIAAVASSPTTREGTTAATTGPAIVTRPHPPISPPLTSPVLSLSQSYSISPDQDQGIEIVSDTTPPASPFRSPTFSDPYDLVVPGSPGPFGSPGSPFIPLSIPPLPISPPLPPSASMNGTGGDRRQQRQPLDLFGSAASMTTTIRQSSSLNPPPQSPSTTTSKFYSFTNDASTATTRQTTPPARPPPAVQSGGILSFPAEANHNQQQQQHRVASPGIMSPMLSELDFVSDSELGSNDDIGSESSWSSARF